MTTRTILTLLLIFNFLSSKSQEYAFIGSGRYEIIATLDYGEGETYGNQIYLAVGSNSSKYLVNKIKANHFSQRLIIFFDNGKSVNLYNPIVSETMGNFNYKLYKWDDANNELFFNNRVTTIKEYVNSNIYLYNIGTYSSQVFYHHPYLYDKTNQVSSVNVKSHYPDTTVVESREELKDISSFEIGNSFIGRTKNVANLRSKPSTTSTIILKIPQNQQVYILNDNIGSTFYPVIYIKTNKLGFINKSLISKISNAPKAQSNSLESTIDTSPIKANPKINIKNRTDGDITVILAGKVYTLRPDAERIIEQIPGTFNLLASAANVIPFLSIEKIESGFSYKWSFIIRTVRTR